MKEQQSKQIAWGIVWVTGIICACVTVCCITFSKPITLEMHDCNVDVRFDDSAKYERVSP